ncbi:hypothetical protein VNPA152081_18120 [Pseudomonas aeruginosa]|uniref:hypothetical protein n=1 Tax=Pseudomonas aeruginosa TaxID=287 RepID=UPI0021E1BDEA|nr:hypothetical protein [Pseudomonas aeruginosa]GLF57956.1 hypothetical protein VNPA141826_21140 [Pseudomonas aeruginosa]GLF76741.1 hypothetical protein VNPA152081_18120 [Pseudomonas aeruginosa]HBP5411292.1 hypothetical protein [Pseudomonas aeruginosa]
MSIKTTGLELKAFWSDESVWPADSYVDGVHLKVNGQDDNSEDIEALNDADQVVLEDGYFCDANDEGENLLTVFKRWRKKQNTSYISASCPKELEEAVRAAIKAAGGTL